MKKLKRIAALLLVVVMMASTFACGKGGNENSTEATTVDRLSLTPEEYYGVDGWEANEYTNI